MHVLVHRKVFRIYYFESYLDSFFLHFYALLIVRSSLFNDRRGRCSGRGREEREKKKKWNKINFNESLSLSMHLLAHSQFDIIDIERTEYNNIKQVNESEQHKIKQTNKKNMIKFFFLLFSSRLLYSYRIFTAESVCFTIHFLVCMFVSQRYFSTCWYGLWKPAYFVCLCVHSMPILV